MDCYETVRAWKKCAQKRVKLWKYSTPMKLFLEIRTIPFVEIDLISELIRIRSGNRFNLVITELFIKIVWKISLKKIMENAVGRVFVHSSVFVYGPPVVVLSDNGTKITYRFFTGIWRILGSKKVYKVTKNKKCNGQVERFNRKVLAPMWSLLDIIRNIEISSRTYLPFRKKTRCIEPQILLVSSSLFQKIQLTWHLIQKPNLRIPLRPMSN